MGFMAKKKNPAAVALGRRGGKKKVPKGFAMDTEKAAAAGRKGAAKRWGKITPELIRRIVEENRKVKRIGQLFQKMTPEEQLDLLIVANRMLPNKDPLRSRIAKLLEGLPDFPFMNQPEKEAFAQEMTDVTLEATKVIQ
jgi:hypothetical protein